MQGKAICGIFSKDFAEAKVSQVEEFAKDHEQPLLCSLENV
jgi:ATP-dependent Clp protease adaptor protein ClpS